MTKFATTVFTVKIQCLEGTTAEQLHEQLCTALMEDFGNLAIDIQAPEQFQKEEVMDEKGAPSIFGYEPDSQPYSQPITVKETDNRDFDTTALALSNGTKVEVNPFDLYINALENLGADFEDKVEDIRRMHSEICERIME